MMASGVWIFGLVFCLLGTVVLAALAFAGFRYFVETGRHGGDGARANSVRGPEAERIGR